MSTYDDKAALRSRLRAMRRGMSEAEVAAKSAAIVGRVLQLSECAEARTWFVYVSVGYEVGTRGLIQRLLEGGKTVCVPRVVGDGVMEAVEIESLAELIDGAMRIPTASLNRKRFSGALDVAVVPGVGFTAAGDRLGGGLGFYDRWLGEHRPRFAMGLAFEVQIVESLPVEMHDVRVDAVVTEARTLRNFPRG